jgi:hypothetical protein
VNLPYLPQFCIDWQKCTAKAHGTKFFVDRILYVVRRPSAHVLEKSDAANVFVIAQIKPMVHPLGHVDHISTLHSYPENGSTIRVQVKNPLSRNRESHFVLGVDVLFVELG